MANHWFAMFLFYFIIIIIVSMFKSRLKLGAQRATRFIFLFFHYLISPSISLVAHVPSYPTFLVYPPAIFAH